MVRKQSSLILACFLSHKHFLICTTAQQEELEIPFFGVFIVLDGIPIAAMEMCRRTHKPTSVVHCMRASDLWSQELRGPFLT